ncbi:HNH endonuclease [Anaerotignum sp.]|uniref:HNH endonuclease n=1 Tax=Anaerotignum sp. TaxID=2039241 RepID=UPI0028A95528|nr:HNH endonuclease signature motif containing protein [Anaerotignum sp.]
MTKKERVKVYEKYNGHCAYCGKEIEIGEMQVDHIKPLRNAGENHIDNYNPACRRCNHYKRSKDLEGFRAYIKTLHERIAKDYIVKVGLDFGIVEIKPFEGVFYFEKEDAE